MDFGAPAYSGFWTNWSRGSILGATLTVPNHWGTALVGAIAIFVQVSGTFSWQVLCYLLHQSRTRERFKDQRHHQQQVVLRNAQSDFAVFWPLYKISRSSKKVYSRAVRWKTSIPAVAALHFVLFVAAGIFSSQVTSAGNDTLIKGDNCGFMTNFSSSVTGSAIARTNMQVDTSRNADLSLRQVQTCNTSSARIDPQCKIFTEQIQLTSEYNASCAVDDASMCTAPSMQLDTGMLDSQAHFGINSPKKDRIKIRKVSTCSPIKQEGFRTDGITAEEANSFPSLRGLAAGVSLSLYYYGLIGNESNFTEAISNWVNATGNGGYYIYYFNSAYQNESDGIQDWVPLPGLNTPTAEFTVIFMQYTGYYLGEVSDPLFKADLRGPKVESLNTSDIFLSSNPASVLGCAYQYQLCNYNVNPPNCTSLMRLMDMMGYIFVAKSMVGFNDAQVFTASRVLYALYGSTMDYIISALNGRILLANNVRSGLYSLPLPENQWQLEVINMHSVMMTGSQRLTAEYAAGPPADLVETLIPPNDGIGKRQCGSQIIRRDDYMNFNVLSVVMVFMTGAMFVGASCCLEPLNRRRQQRTELGRLRNASWEKDELLELDRAASEPQRRDEWKFNFRSSIPSTSEESQHLGLQGAPEIGGTREKIFIAKSNGPSIVNTKFFRNESWI